MEYNPGEHLLLWDVAHSRCIHDEVEYQQFVDRVRQAGIAPFAVDIPEWPPALREPLPIIIMQIGGEDEGWQPQGGPTSAMKWEGTQLAVMRDRWDEERTVREIVGQIVPDYMMPEHRVGYAWQVPVFDPQKHVVIRYWCERNGVDIVDFWMRFYPTVDKKLEVFEAVNPRIYDEMEEGSYSPTRRCIRKSQLHLLRNEYLGTDEEQPEPEDVLPKPAPSPKPQPRLEHDSPETGDAPVKWNMHEGVEAYPGHEVLYALEQALGRDVRPFTGTTLDQQVVAIRGESMIRYLAANPVSERQYILDSGGRNFDCDDFALTLRSALIRDHGYNCCAVIAGDVHAWCAFILVGEKGPKVAFVEPQTDGVVTELTGNYSVEKRCEVLV